MPDVQQQGMKAASNLLPKIMHFGGKATAATLGKLTLGNSRQQKHCDFDIESTTSDAKFIAEESYQKEETSDLAIVLVSIKNPGADGFETEEEDI